MAESVRPLLRQAWFPSMCPVEDALEGFAAAGIEERGAIFTRREVVEFILDLLSYTPDRALYQHRILEPSFGAGDFLLIVVDRLLRAWKRQGDRHDVWHDLKDSLRAVELHQASYDATSLKVIALLTQEGIAPQTAAQLAGTWLICGDFLQMPLPGPFDHVVGNPPYVRQERIPDALIAEYRSRYTTIFDRADLYIPFIERSLSLLSEGGALGFICADRWMKNRYGRLLRRMVAERFHLKTFVDMVDTSAFHKDVTAYPAITIIGREKPGKTRTARRPEINGEALRALARELLSPQTPAPGSPVKEFSRVVMDAEPWLLASSDQVTLVRRLEHDFPLLEDTGCKVGIGVATGADKAFIGPHDELDVEPDRKLPLAMTRDILSGEVKWRGLGIVNPFADAGGLVDLGQYPRLRCYLEARRGQLAKRHIARKAPANWYRTIDRMEPALAKTPKLLIPDIKGEAQIVYENGRLYPHHNLYFITSDAWELRALQAVLQSGIARLFVSIYSTRMRGGYLRFQAQYLRRIRLPHWPEVPDEIKTVLTAAAKRGDTAACKAAVFKLYRLSSDEQAALGGNVEE